MKKIRLGDPVKHIRWKNFIGTAEDYYIENGKKYLIVRLAPRFVAKRDTYYVSS